MAVEGHQFIETNGSAIVQLGDDRFTDLAFACIQGDGYCSAFRNAIVMNRSRVQAFRAGCQFNVNGRGAVVVSDQLGSSRRSGVVRSYKVLGNAFYRIGFRIGVAVWIGGFSVVAFAAG